MMRPRRLAHFNLYVSNLEAATGFYQDVCGIRYIAAEPHVPIRFFTNGSSHHELGLIELREGDRIGRDGFVQGTTKPGQKPGLNHLGWEMESEAQLVDAYRRLKSTGVISHTADHTIARSVYVADPDGNYHEFFADTPLDWHTFLQGDLPPITGRWDPEEGEPCAQGHYPKDPRVTTVSEAPVHPLWPSHGALRVRDLQAMCRFLREVAGLSEVTVSENDGFALYKGSAGRGQADLIILKSTENGAGSLHHMAFALESERAVEECLQRLRERGHEPVRTIEGRGKLGFVLADPDGLLIEFSARAPSRSAGAGRSNFDVHELV